MKGRYVMPRVDSVFPKRASPGLTDPKEHVVGFVSVVARAEEEGLLTFTVKNGERVMILTQAGSDWCGERGLAGVVPEDASNDLMLDALVAFFALYSRTIGIPMTSDALMVEAIEAAERRLANEG